MYVTVPEASSFFYILSCEDKLMTEKNMQDLCVRCICVECVAPVSDEHIAYPAEKHLEALAEKPRWFVFSH